MLHGANGELGTAGQEHCAPGHSCSQPTAAPDPGIAALWGPRSHPVPTDSEVPTPTSCPLPALASGGGAKLPSVCELRAVLTHQPPASAPTRVWVLTSMEWRPGVLRSARAGQQASLGVDSQDAMNDVIDGWQESDRFLVRKGWVPGETPLSSQERPEAWEPGC